MTGASRWIGVASIRDVPLLSARGFVLLQTLDVEGEDGARSLSTDASDDAVLLRVALDDELPGIVPWSSVVEHAVGSERVRRELLARSFDNFDPSELNVVVREDLFQREPARWSDDEDPVDGASEPNGEVHDPADRRAGGACGLLMVPVPEPHRVLRDEVAADLLNGADDVAGVLERLVIDASERELLVAAVGLMSRVDPAASFGARAAAEELAAVVDSKSTAAQDLARIEDVLRGKRDLPEFHSGVGRPSAKAVLMVLSRPDPHDALTWAASAPDDALTVALACALSGIRAGWSRLPASWKVDRQWRSKCEAFICDSLVPDADWSSLAQSPVGAVVPVQEQLSLGGDNEDGVRAARTDEEIRTLLEAVLVDDAIAAACARICEAEGWSDLVVTVIDTQGQPFLHESSAIRVEGPVFPRFVVDERFLHRWDPSDGTRPSLALRKLLQEQHSSKRQSRSDA